MTHRRWVYLLTVITLLASTGRAAAAGHDELPTGRVSVNTASVSAPHFEASTLASDSVNLTLLSQSFQSVNMPLGWQTQTLNITRTWTIVDAAIYPTYVHSGSYAAWVESAQVSQDEWLSTPPIAIPLSLTDAKLSFWACTVNTSITRTATVTVSIINGLGVASAIWRLSDEYWPGPDYYYRQVQYDLTPYIGQTIKIAWRYLGYNSESFGLDDIEISGNAEGIWIPIVLK